MWGETLTASARPANGVGARGPSGARGERGDGTDPEADVSDRDDEGGAGTKKHPLRERTHRGGGRGTHRGSEAGGRGAPRVQPDVAAAGGSEGDHRRGLSRRGAGCVLGGAPDPAPGRGPARGARRGRLRERRAQRLWRRRRLGARLAGHGGSTRDGPGGLLRGRGSGRRRPQPRGQHTPKKKEQSPARLEPRGTGTSSTPPASQAGSEGTAASEGDSGARGGDARPPVRRQRSSFSGNLRRRWEHRRRALGRDRRDYQRWRGGGAPPVAQRRWRKRHHMRIWRRDPNRRGGGHEGCVFTRLRSPARGGSREGRTRARTRRAVRTARRTAARAASRFPNRASFQKRVAPPGASGTRRGLARAFRLRAIRPITPRAQTRAEASFRTPPALFPGSSPASRAPWAAPAGTASPFLRVRRRRRGFPRRGRHSSRRPSKDGGEARTPRRTGCEERALRHHHRRRRPANRVSREVLAATVAAARVPRTRAGREQREDTFGRARGAREDTPPAPGNSVDSGGLGGAIGDARGAILDPRGRRRR